MKSIHVSDKMLRAFDQTARAGSFTAAALVLGVGQPAVSHAVARLEAALGSTLFERSASGVALTPAGVLLHERIRPAFDEIDAAVRSVAVRDQATVTVSVSTSTATYWLMPRMAGFKASHPGVELRVLTTDTDRNVGLDDADLWVPLGDVVDPGLERVPFRDEELVPVGSASLAATVGRARPEALLGVPLLHLEERYEPRFDWFQWFREVGVEAVAELPGVRSNDYSIILHAAIDGQGAALGWWHIVEDLVADGRLVELGPRVRTERPFHIYWRRSRPLSDAAGSVLAWLTAP